MSMNLHLAIIFGSFSAGFLGWSVTRTILTKIKIHPLKNPSPDRLVMNSSQKILLSGILLCLLVTLFGNFFLGLLLLVLFLMVWLVYQKGPTWKRERDLKKRQEKMGSVFPQALGMAVQALKTGQTVPQVLEYLSRESPSPLKDELASVCAEMDLGASAEQAITKMAERFPNFSEFNQFLESYKISRQTGANLTHLLQVLMEGMEEKNRLLRKMDAMTAQAKLSGLMIGLLPFFLAFVFFLMDPNLIIPLFTEKIGWAILLLAAILETIGFAWIRQLLRLEV
jgi:tight adherence protein B